MSYKFITTPERSSLMKKIKSTNTRPELLLRKTLYSQKIRFRVKSNLIGKPDIVFTKSKVVVFIDGEFWHGYNWKEKKRKINANKSYWIKKIEGNIKRDKKNNLILKQEGWTVLRFWQKEVETNLDHCILLIKEAINQ